MGEPLTFGALLKSIREGEEETQDVFGERLGVSKQYVYQIETGNRRVSLEQAARFADALGYNRLGFVQLCMQDMLDSAGIEAKAKVEVA